MIKVVKIKNHHIPWDKIREIIVIILGVIFMAAAFFQAGWIIRDLRTDDTRDRLSKTEERQHDLQGRIVILEGKGK